MYTITEISRPFASTVYGPAVIATQSVLHELQSCAHVASAFAGWRLSAVLSTSYAKGHDFRKRPEPAFILRVPFCTRKLHAAFLPYFRGMPVDQFDSRHINAVPSDSVPSQGSVITSSPRATGSVGLMQAK